jgi:protein-disulfide isomerase
VSSNEELPLNRARTGSSRRAHLRTLLAFAGGAGGSLLAAGCGHKPPHVPTHAAPPRPGQPPDPSAEVLDTEDGPIPLDRLDPQQGPRDAHCVLVVFSDFQCPFCKDTADVLARLRKELPKQTRLVFKHLPTPMHYHARAASIAAQVVFLEAGTEAFWRFHDRAFAHQHEIDEFVLAAWAREEGVPAEAITARSAEAEKRVSEDIALAERLGIHGTPHLYVNARTIAGAYPYEQVREWVNDEIS